MLIRIQSVTTSGTYLARFSLRERLSIFTIGGYLLVCLSPTASFIAAYYRYPAELQMRRPNKGKYRLDRLLERKAKEGIKIYIIL